GRLEPTTSTSSGEIERKLPIEFGYPEVTYVLRETMEKDGDKWKAVPTWMARVSYVARVETRTTDIASGKITYAGFTDDESVEIPVATVRDAVAPTSNEKAAASAGPASQRAPLVVTAADLDAALKATKPSGARAFAIETPNVHWSDVAGLGEA